MCPSPVTHLVVSPHLDDGVLSRGALISAWRRAGHRVIVVTIFTGRPDGPLGPAAEADHERYPGDPLEIRAHEDRAAAEVLGFETLWLGLPELVYRTRTDGSPRASSLDDLYGALDAGDEAIISEVAAALTVVTDSSDPDWVHAPMGIGNHLDHAITHRAVRAAVRRPVAFYEDLPYAFDAPATTGPAGTELVHPWALGVDDAEQWIEAISCYPTQIANMFESADWKSRFGEWVSNGRAGDLFVEGGSLGVGTA